MALVEAQLKGIDIFEYAPASNAATDYANLTDEILNKI
ncbi:ParA family protein [Pedobacter sp. NJ-S-72]